MRPILFGVTTLVALAVGNTAFAGRYDTIVTQLKQLEAAHSDVMKVVTIGKNESGVDIRAARVSLTPETMDKKKIGHLIVGPHHGNEGGGALLAMTFLKNLVKRFESDAVFRTDLGETEWLVIPVLNTPGYDANQRRERNIDPNRDYPGPCTSAPGGKLKSTLALRNLYSLRSWVGTATLHGYIGVLAYPWGMNADNTHTQDHNFFDRITEKAAEENNYSYGTSTDTIYPADGCYEDWAYWKHGTYSLLVELRDSSQGDASATAEALTVWFDELDRAPSTHHTLTSGCQRAGALDLQNE